MKTLIAILSPFPMVFFKIFPELKPRDKTEQCYSITQKKKKFFFPIKISFLRNQLEKKKSPLKKMSLPYKDK